MKLQRLASVFGVLFIAVQGVMAQKVAFKTNFVGDALLSPNAAVEVGVAPKWTAELSGQFNFWDVNGHKWKHWVVQPEVRYWLCQRYSGHFFGAHLLGGEYNFGNIDANFKFLGSDFRNLRDMRYQGWAVGAGLAYGYAWPVARNWNIEAELGLGWIYTRYDSYPCTTCGKKVDSNKPHNYVGPTKAALNIVYLF